MRIFYWIVPVFFCTTLFPNEEELEKFGQKRYAQESEKHQDYRRFDESSPETVKQFYFFNHSKQTVDFVQSKRTEYVSLKKGKMRIWDAMKLLDRLVDESDPDIHLSQTYHAFQTAEALRKDGQPRWLILTGLIHDLGKMLISYGEPQWAIVGDTFPVGCAYSDLVVFPSYFENNPDFQNPIYQDRFGIYSPNCGYDNILMSWGHDEYLYYVLKDYLPSEASYIIRYHSFVNVHHPHFPYGEMEKFII